MQFETFEEFLRTALEGRLLRGDVVYVSSDLYASLTEPQRGLLWRHALDQRLRLVTDLDVDPPIVVHRTGGAGDVGPEDALRRR